MPHQIDKAAIFQNGMREEVDFSHIQVKYNSRTDLLVLRLLYGKVTDGRTLVAFVEKHYEDCLWVARDSGIGSIEFRCGGAMIPSGSVANHFAVKKRDLEISKMFGLQNTDSYWL